MVQRTTALCNGKIIGIETIYTVSNGCQINIPEKLKELRNKSQNNELFCPCGCGSNLILVAGDKNLREQHFRLKSSSLNQDCNAINEGKISIISKIVLKCWLDDKLMVTDIESRVPIHTVDDISRKYEFSFLSQSRKIAISYCRNRADLTDEKLGILEGNSQGIHIIYVVDSMNGDGNGQYPEGLMKIQNKQGYCLLLIVSDMDYNKAKLKAVFYIQDLDGLWQEVTFAEEPLKHFSINDEGQITCTGGLLIAKLSEAKRRFIADREYERVKRIEEEKRQAENLKKMLAEMERKREEGRRQQEIVEQENIRQAEEAAKRRAELEEKQRLEEEKFQEEKRQRSEDFKRNMESNFSQQETQVRDADGKRWIKCEFCGKIARENEFCSYGGAGHINLGTCKECSANNPAVKQKMVEKSKVLRAKYDANICPQCGGSLRERNGRYGRFIGCSNYPKCRYSRKIVL